MLSLTDPIFTLKEYYPLPNSVALSLKKKKNDMGYLLETHT